ncbi:hypothetical protein KOW79_020961 [Hemibagrus wyckioides]|uniref:Ig-like domain-containing protein n=2 Tax=Hemibagrus wyckioides TaxID=337641 RepID=A0A9D3N7U2_9TELE|nr:hypothetical protein KOW79_020961 [Hemibagrus wyckioides]
MSPKLAPPLSLLLLLLISGLAVAQNNWSVNYTHTYICAVRKSTVTMGCSYIYNSTNSTFHQTFWSVHSYWFGDLSSRASYRGRVQYLRETPNDCSLRMTNVVQDDYGKYYVTFNTSAGKVFQDKNGVMLEVTALHVEKNLARVFIGDEVILTCKYNCNLTETPTFFWYRNGIYFSSTSSLNQLRLPSVNRSDAGEYRCAVQKDGYRSHYLRLNVLTGEKSSYMTGYLVVVVVVLCGVAALIAGLYYMRRKRQKASNNVTSPSQQNAGEDISTPPDPNSISANDMYNTLESIYSDPTDDTYTALDLQTRSNGVYDTLTEVHSSPPDDTYTNPDSLTISSDYYNLPV